MGKLIKVIVVLALVVGAVLLVVYYSSGTGGEDETARQDSERAEKEGVQVQEKYGFAPIDE